MSATRPLLPAVVLGLLLVAAQAADGVRITEAVLDDDGSTRLTITVGTEGPALGSGAFTITEDGRAVDLDGVEPLLEAEAVDVVVVLAIDHSGSTRGEPLAAAQRAGLELARDLVDEGAAVGLVAFSDRVTAAVPPARTGAQLEPALSGLTAAGETAVYDALSQAAVQLEGAADAQRHVVLFSDGGDTASASDLAAATQALTDARVKVHVVALATSELDAAALDAIVAGTNGTQRTIATAGALAAAFDSVVTALTSQYVVTYTRADRAASEVEIAVSVRAGGADLTDAIVAANPVPAPVPAPLVAATPARRSPVPAFSGRSGLVVGTGAAGMAVFALALLLVGGQSRTRAERVLRENVASRRKGRRVARSVPTLGALRQYGAAAVERLPGFERSEERLQARLDRAGWPVRASEFVAMRALSGTAAGVLGALATSTLFVAAIAGPLGAVVPDLLLARRVRERRRALDEALPEVLHLLAGSLRAGYGLMQALDLAAREGTPPLSEELSRALTEVRLGVPIGDALAAMGERLEHRDLRWVIMAIDIQLDVGGNLSELLQTVADTIRSRQQLRRHVAALSADGRLSAIVLSLLPVAAAGLLVIVDRSYIAPLFATGAGLVLLGASAVFWGLGIAWIRRIVRVEM